MSGNWKTYKLGDLYTVTSGLSKSREEFGFGHSFVTFKDVFYNYFLPSELTSLANTTEKEIKSCSVKKGDVFLTRTSETPHELGMSSVALKDYEGATFNGFTKRLRLKEGVKIEIDPVFIGYCLRTDSFRNQVNMHATMTTRASLNSAAINSIEVSMPDFDSQIQIGEILKSLDDKIALNVQTNKTLEEIVNALYKHWFVDFGPFKNGKFIKSELGMIPEGWKDNKINQLFNLTIGRTPPRKEQEWFSKNPNDIKWISIKDMGIAGAYIYTTSEYLTKEAVAKHNVPKIPINTVVLSFKLTVGRLTITTEEMLSNEAIAHFIPTKDNYLTPEFTYLFLKNFNYESLGSTSSIATAVNSQTIKNIDILFPNKTTIDSFHSSVGNLFEKIKQNTKETDLLKQTRDYLLPKLISGEVRIKDAVKKIKETV